jgi:hypothetical protein
MATNRDLLKEAIADAKAVKEMAIANAKAALEEAFTPQLKTMLSAKLQEMELEEEKEVEEAEIDEVGFEDMNTLNTGVTEEKADEDNLEEIDLEELLAELEEDEEKMVNESELTEEDQEEEYVGDDERYEYEKGKEAGEKEEGEALDLEDMTDEDLKKFIEDVITDMVESGELEAGEGAEEEEGEDMDVDVDVDVEEEEVDLAELLKEIENMEEMGKYYEDQVGEAEEDKLMEDEVTNTDAQKAMKNLSPEELAYVVDQAKGLVTSKDIKLAKDISEAYNLNENETASVKSDELKQEMDKDISKLKRDTKIAKLAQKAGLTLGALSAIGWVAALATGAPGMVATAASIGVPLSIKIVSALAGLVGGGSAALGGAIQQDKKEKALKRKERERSKLEEELYESYDTIKILKKELNEINLLNAKLLYTNKIFRSKNLTESQKVKVLGSFDNATTVKETKLVFETLNEGIKVKKPSVEKTLGRASKATNTPTTKKPIVESNDAYLRMQKLAGLI